MSLRLTDRFRVGDRVEIYWRNQAEGHWQAGRVTRLDPPGVWVATVEGGHWFVTNGRRIRPWPAETHDRAEA